MVTLGVQGSVITEALLKARLSDLRQALEMGRGRLLAIQTEAAEIARAIGQTEGAILEIQGWLRRLSAGSEEEHDGDET